jgi:cytochrome c biogenesis protein CcmG/thiol:disulfide interchange protein DsbE
LTELAKDRGLQLVGINYKDEADNARRFLGGSGNPFSIVGADDNGRGGIEWGVYGVPETFVVGRNGMITYKLVGPITAENSNGVLRAEIDKAMSAPS